MIDRPRKKNAASAANAVIRTNRYVENIRMKQIAHAVDEDPPGRAPVQRTLDAVLVNSCRDGTATVTVRCELVAMVTIHRQRHRCQSLVLTTFSFPMPRGTIDARTSRDFNPTQFGMDGQIVAISGTGINWSVGESRGGAGVQGQTPARRSNVF